MEKLPFCEYIFDLRSKSGITRADMARRWPWHRNTLVGYETDRLPETEYLYAVSVETKHSFADLIRRRLLAGFLDLPDDFELNFGIDKHFESVGSADSPNELEVDDDSMSPTILEGSTICIDRTDKKLKQGSLYAITLNDFIVVRMIQYGINGDITLTAHNKNHPDMNLDKADIPGEVILGRVISCTNKF